MLDNSKENEEGKNPAHIHLYDGFWLGSDSVGDFTFLLRAVLCSASIFVFNVLSFSDVVFEL